MTAAIESDLAVKLSRLEAWYLEQGAADSARKVKDLIEKRLSGELTIAICGHFSAGKSSLINALCGSSVLPSGPLPTTANIAGLRDGAPRMQLTPTDGGHEAGKKLSREPLSVIDGALLDDYCRDGAKYEMVSIWRDIPLLRQGGVLLDTPGVDSGEAAHALATSSALHLADIVFYVMDYNHVQSGSNLSFARSIAEWGKPLYLVINQVDKHQEEEQTFEQYMKSVEHAFSVWGISPAAIYCTSLKEPDHQRNQLPELKQVVIELLNRKEALLEFSIACSLHHEAQQFKKRTEEAAGERRRELEALTGDEGVSVDQLRGELKELELRMTSNQAEPPQAAVRREWTAKLDQLLENAYLMTADLRETAEKYLESREAAAKPGFRLFKNKSIQERQRRQQEFLERLDEQVKAQIDWHVRDMIRKLGKASELWDAEWEARLEQELPQMEAAWIENQTSDGAVISGEYTLHYTSAVAAEIRGRYRRTALALAEGLLVELAPRFAAEQAGLAARHAELAGRVRAAERLQAQSAAASETAEQLEALLGAWTPLPAGLLPKAEAREGRGVPAALPRPAAQRQPQAPTPVPQPRAAGAGTA
ncbi:dynamin family protein, partial [Paenibacillus brevis]